MSKIILIIIGVVIAVLGIITLFPMTILSIWLSVILIGIGIIGIILGFLDRRKPTGKIEIKREEPLKKIADEEKENQQMRKLFQPKNEQ